VYIGSAIDIKDRMKYHKSDLKHFNHHNTDLQVDYNLYGKFNFKYIVLEECDVDVKIEREQYWIDFYGGKESIKNYNLKDAGPYGKHNKSTIEKIGIASTGRTHIVSEEQKQNLREINLGNKFTPEQYKKICEDNFGKKQNT